MAAPRLASSWQARAEAGEPFAVIRVRDLQGTIQAGTDAWGRENKLQPVRVSAELSMASPFDAASSSDRVSDDTVHYGLLAKAILSSLVGINKKAQSAGKPSHIRLRDAVGQIWADLTGLSLDGQYVPAEEGSVGFLRDRLSLVRFMNLNVTLPKASLLGSAVSLSAAAVFSPQGGPSPVDVRSSCLRLHDLRVPTLIGVNDNERLERQILAADVEIEQFDVSEDVYVGIESIVAKVSLSLLSCISNPWSFWKFSYVRLQNDNLTFSGAKTLSGSSFETLEALGPAITQSIRKDIKGVAASSASQAPGWVIKVAMEKPTAIVMAEASRVEYRELVSARA
ncbi:FolB domain-containing protein [Colletotrichum asianum]|uniref:FolB domain-containing protein n=1 Tax=Colletotrichum asianum TaxID=702518 RepID=A0A8H3W4R6_9PEZI|nr:folB domain-containing protein [Colletotrichum asianum]